MYAHSKDYLSVLVLVVVTSDKLSSRHQCTCSHCSSFRFVTSLTLHNAASASHRHTSLTPCMSIADAASSVCGWKDLSKLKCLSLHRNVHMYVQSKY
jgi:hypothetical protein